jgi:hypothetical protein
MTQPRYNGFLMIHKALRAMLMDMTLELQHANFLNLEKTNALLQKLETVIDTFDVHANHENTLIIPLIQEQNPEIYHQFEEEHEADHELGERLKTAMDALKTEEDATTRLSLGAQILYAFYDFTAFNFSHMNREETILNDVLWKHFTDEKLIKVNQQIVRNNTPEQMQTAAYWMLKGCSNEEIRNWMMGAKKGMPEATFNALIELANRVLPAERSDVITASLAA